MNDDAFLQRAGRIAGIGGWRVDLTSGTVEWSEQTCRILDAPLGFRPTLDYATSMYTAASRPVIERLLGEAVANGTPWDVELQMLTATGRLIWTRSVGEVEMKDGRAVALAGAFQDTSARKAAEAEHLAAVELTRNFYDNAPCGYYSLGPDRTILRVNDRLLTWLGRTRDQVLGRAKPTDFMTPDSLPPAREAFTVLMRDGEVSDLHCELLPVNGRTRHVSISATAIFDEAGAFIQSRSVMFDITDLVRVREEATKLAADQTVMLDNDLIGIIKLSERRIVWANRAMHRMFGFAEGELVGQLARIGYRDDSSFQALGATAYPLLAAGETFKTEIEMARKDGSSIWISMNATALSGPAGETMWMMADISESKHHAQEIERIAYLDALTGLPNRLLLTDRLRQTLASAERNRSKVAVCYLDLDGFKAVNDRFGHAAGDALLVEVAGRLLGCIRANDTVCRLGGDEFVMVLADIDGGAELDGVLQRVLASVAELVELQQGIAAHVTASIGVAVFPDDSEEKGILLRKADHAMYVAKSLGKSRFVRATADAATSADQDLE